MKGVPRGQIIMFTAADLAEHDPAGLEHGGTADSKRLRVINLLVASGVPVHRGRAEDSTRSYNIRDLVDGAHVGYAFDGIYHKLHWFPNGTVIE